MQTPTCKNVRIRSIQDVHKIFAAVQQGWLKMITRRLDTEERLDLCAGCIYVWEERGPNTEVTGLGMERFTEGRRWSPSRVRDDFLFYFEQYSGGESGDAQPPQDWDPLTKQTYSAVVQTERGPRKWHMTAYYNDTSRDMLGTIDDIEGVRDIVVQEGAYTSQKAAKNKPEKKRKGGVTRKYAGFPQPNVSMAQDPSAQPVQMFDPYASHASQVYERNDAGTSSQQIFPHLSSTSRPPGHSTTPLQPSRYVEPQFTAQPRPNRTPQIPAQILTSTGPSYPSNSYSPYMSPASYPSPGSSASSSSSYGMGSPVIQPTDQQAQQWYSPHGPSDATVNYGDMYHAPSYPPPYAARQDPHPSSAPATSATFASASSSSIYDGFVPVPGIVPRHSAPTPMSSSTPYQADDPFSPYQGPPSPVSDDEQGSYSYSGGGGGAGRKGDVGPSRDLAPLHLLRRNHPYRRDPVDDNALRKLDPRPLGATDIELPSVGVGVGVGGAHAITTE